jgi:outer membrane protein assembly factor BamB
MKEHYEMSHTIKRTTLLLLALTFLASATIFTFVQRGVFNAHASASGSKLYVPAVSGVSIYFGSDNDGLYALDAAHGLLRWPSPYEFPPGGDTWSPIIVVTGVLYLEVSNSTNTAVVSLRSDSSKRWTFTFPAQSYGEHAIAVDNGAVYFAVDSSIGSSYIYALSAKNGSILWTKAAAAGEYFGNPVVTNGVLYVAQFPFVTGNPTQLVALNSTNGTVVWSTPPDLPAQPSTNLAESNGVIYFGDVTGSLDAFNETTAHLNWRSQIDGGPVSTPTLVSNVIYYASASDFVTAVNVSDGSLHWHYLIGKPFATTVSPVMYDHVIYIGSMNTYMYAINADGSSFGAVGTPYWRTKIGTSITTTAVVKNNIVHVGLQNGTLRTLNATGANGVIPGKQRWFFHSNGCICTSSPPAEA